MKYVTEYSIENAVPSPVYSYFKTEVSSLEENHFKGTFFAGFPIIQDGGPVTIYGLFVCENGLFLYSENEKQKAVFSHAIESFLLPILNTEEIKSIFFIDIAKKQKTYEAARRDLILFPEKKVNEIIAAILGSMSLRKVDNRQCSKKGSIGETIKKRSEIIAKFDQDQFESIYKDNERGERIRGLAGSGKTIILVKKLAYLHFRYPEKQLAFVFYSKSLKQYIDGLFKEYYNDFSPSEPDMSKINIMHAWGSYSFPGFYYDVCKRIGVPPQSFEDNSDFESICKEALDNIRSPLDMYDWILIDEAQDFRVNFFKLAQKSLKEFGKLVYAYDELQTLNQTANPMPSPKEIFGEQKYDDIPLRTCYRSPNSIIVTAHAIGLGIYRKNKKGESEFANVVEDKSVWGAIGYFSKEGSIDYGKETTLFRNDLTIPSVSKPIILKNASEKEQYDFVSSEILSLITKEDVKSEDIMIIDMDAIDLSKDYLNFIETFNQKLAEQGLIDADGKRKININLVNKEQFYRFRTLGSIPFTTIFRAKGNEANIVFLLNIQDAGSFVSVARNRIFTGMTRAKTMEYLIGSGEMMDEISQEILETEKRNYTLHFVYPTKEELKEYKNKIYKEDQSSAVFNQAVELGRRASAENPNITLELLMKQAGVKNADDLIALIKNASKNSK